MVLDRLQWASQLGSFIVGKAQAMYWALQREDAYNFEKVKATMLHHLDLTPEHNCKLFRASIGKEDHKPRSLMQLLKDFLNKWVPLEKVVRTILVYQILLQQFVKDLDDETQLLVQRHLPKMAKDALRGTEAFTASEVDHSKEKGYKGVGATIKREEEPQRGLFQYSKHGVICYQCGRTGHMSRECTMCS